MLTRTAVDPREILAAALLHGARGIATNGSAVRSLAGPEELLGRDGGEDDVGLPWLAGGAGDEEPPGVVGEDAPAEAEGGGDEARSRVAVASRPRPQQARAQPEDRVDERDRVEVEGAGDVEHQGGGGADEDLVPLPEFGSWDEAVEERRRRLVRGLRPEAGGRVDVMRERDTVLRGGARQ
jgi:hypothetical protein